MKILVTGAAGFIGSAFVRHILTERPEDHVVILDALTYAGNLDNLAPVADSRQFEFVQGDIADPQVVKHVLVGCDAVVNFAAETHVDRSILDGEDFVRTNVVGTWVLAEAASTARVGRFIQVSTDEVYGAILTGASTESDALDPTSPYAASKAGGELLVRAACKTFGLTSVIIRGANAYGPYQYPEKLIPLHITNALDEQPLPVYGDGQQHRQWTYVEDFARGVDTVLRRGVVGDIYNLGNPESEHVLPSNLDISRRIIQLTGKSEGLLQFVTDRPAHDRRYRVDSSRLMELGWRPRWTFEEGLAATVEWYASNEQWWRPLKNPSYRAYYERNYGERVPLLENLQPAGSL